MSGGKKKSSFQITSVTTDYEGPCSPGGSDPPASPAPTATARLPNGEPGPEPPAAAAAGGKSTPRTGSPPLGAPAAAAASRFRVVKLPQGLGEPYRRGRWTCVDVYERDLEPPGLGRLLDGARGTSGGTGGRSLDSRLELASLGLGTASALAHQPGPAQGPSTWLRPPPTSPGPQARSLTGGLGQLAAKAKAEMPPREPEPEPAAPGADSAGPSRAATPLPTVRVEAGSAAGTPPLPRGQDGALRLRMELAGPEEAAGQALAQDSRPSSPALFFFPDASLVPRSPDPLGTVAAQNFNLARSMLAISGHLDGDDDSSGGLVGIDNKIEQAMDLVKSHLMFAVREEVEVLKEQIRDLAERNAALEQENGLLRALASPEQLAQLPSSGLPRLGPPAPNGPSV